MLSKRFVYQQKINIAISIFLILFFIIHWTKPSIIYNLDGGFRPFGVGYSDKTVLPIWIIAIILAILSYLLVLVYISMS
jgi:hypothetical protein